MKTNNLGLLNPVLFVIGILAGGVVGSFYYGNQISELYDINDQLSSDFDAQETLCETLSEELNTSKEEYMLLSDNIKNMTQYISALDENYTVSLERITIIEEDLNNALNEYSDLQDSYLILDGQYEDLMIAYEELLSKSE